MSCVSYTTTKATRSPGPQGLYSLPPYQFIPLCVRLLIDLYSCQLLFLGKERMYLLTAA